MSEIFKKLNLKDQMEILVLNSPESFENELADLHDVRIAREIDDFQGIEFSLAFVIKQVDLYRISSAVASKAEGDALVWFAYPKKSSKKYKCEFTRDTGWHVLGDAGFEPVRMVAIDGDWSALRFRCVDNIKNMRRKQSFAKTTKGATGPAV